MIRVYKKARAIQNENLKSVGGLHICLKVGESVTLTHGDIECKMYFQGLDPLSHNSYKFSFVGPREFGVHRTDFLEQIDNAGNK